MKKLLGLAALFFLTGVQMELCAQEPAAENKILIAYFSWSGNTRGIARQIREKTGGDIFEIECVEAYPRDYRTCTEQAKREQFQQARPALKNHLENMAQYEIVMLGYPNWWSSIPMPIASFLEEYDFSGKTILPFCSHGGGGIGESLAAIEKLAPRAKIAPVLKVAASGGGSLANDIAAWLRQNNLPVK